MFTHRSASKVKANISSTTKTHLIRGAFYLFLLLSAFVIPLALGQRYVTGSSGDENTLRAPNCTTLSQYDNAATEPPLGIGSQQFEPAMAAFDDQAADDFVVNLLPLNFFYITEVRVMGEYSQGGGPASSFNVYLYRDAPGHLPGELIQALLNQPYTGTPPDFTIHLTSGLLDSGTYWISCRLCRISIQMASGSGTTASFNLTPVLHGRIRETAMAPAA